MQFIKSILAGAAILSLAVILDGCGPSKDNATAQEQQQASQFIRSAGLTGEGFTFQTTSEWPGGYCAQMQVTNGTGAGAALDGWTVSFELASGMSIASLWDGRWTAQGAVQTVQNVTWNASVPSGGTLSFGFCGSHAGTISSPFHCTLNGLPCGAEAADTQPPSQVVGLRLTASSSTSVDLIWQSATDNLGVSEYEVFLNEDGSPMATTAGTGLHLEGLSPGTAYAFSVRAVDAASNRSPASARLFVTTAGGSGTQKLIGYYPRWGVYERAFYAKNLDTSGMAAKLTHLNYAFGNVMNGTCGIFPVPHGDAWADYQMVFSASDSVDGVADNWEQPLRGNFNQLKKLKEKYPHLKVLISLGGWTWSGGFSEAASTPTRRQAFVQSCIDLYIRGNLPEGPAHLAAGIFDGFDIDWEFPAADGLQPGLPEDTANFTALMAEFRRQLDAVRPGLLLSIATGSRADVYSQIELDLIQPYIDFVSIMTYDMHGGWDPTANFHAALYNPSVNPARVLRDSVHEAVQGHLAAGVPASKLVMSVPFFGRGWQSTQPGPAMDGLYQPTAGPAQGNWDDATTGHTGMFDYHYILGTLEPSGVKYRHPEALVPYLYNPTTGLWVSYDDPVSMAAKAAYVNSYGLAGIAIWELSGDDAQGSLVTALKSGLSP